MAGNQKVQNADALVSVDAQLAQTAVERADLKALLVPHQAIAALGHDERDKFTERVQSTEQTAVLAVAHTASRCCHGDSSCCFQLLNYLIIQCLSAKGKQKFADPSLPPRVRGRRGGAPNKRAEGCVPAALCPLFSSRRGFHFWTRSHISSCAASSAVSSSGVSSTAPYLRRRAVERI